MVLILLRVFILYFFHLSSIVLYGFYVFIIVSRPSFWKSLYVRWPPYKYYRYHCHCLSIIIIITIIVKNKYDMRCIVLELWPLWGDLLDYSCILTAGYKHVYFHSLKFFHALLGKTIILWKGTRCFPSYISMGCAEGQREPPFHKGPLKCAKFLT